jgi:hypothetical protein
LKLLQIFFLRGGAWFLQGVLLFYGVFWMVIRGESVVDACKFVVLSSMFFAVENMPVF